MVGCFVGRGSLLVSVLGTSGGFHVLSGESEVTLTFQEDNESVIDGRHGVNERVDWYVRNYRQTLVAECFRIEQETLELLLKANYNAVAGSAAPVVLPNPVTIGNEYLLRPNITPGSLSVTDALAAVVDTADYIYDTAYGTIKFTDTAGYTQPFTVALTTTGHSVFGLNGKNQILCEALIKGVNKVTGQKMMAHFYRLAIDVSEELKMVQRGFAVMSIRLQATPDTSQPLDATLGQYGRIILL